MEAQLFTGAADQLSGGIITPYHTDPLAFLNDCVYTRDEADPTQPIKRWPAGACPVCKSYVVAAIKTCPRCATEIKPLDYVKELVWQWKRASPPIMIVPKPRRFKVSWLFSALHTWLGISRRESAIYFQSRTEDESALLIDRCEFLLQNIPTTKMKIPGWERRRKPPAIHFENGSQIIGKPEGPKVLRSVTATAIFLDEVAFWENARGSYDAIKPLVEKGCRLTIVSTANPGFFRSLVEGDL
jgi:hypothetical protein